MDKYRTISNIRTAHWQPAIGMPGGVVEGFDDIAQAIRNILTTLPGTDRHRPEFGWGGFIYIDWPVQRAIPHLVRETIIAVNRWEQRVQVQKVDIRTDAFQVFVNVSYKVAKDVLQQIEVVYERSTAA